METSIFAVDWSELIGPSEVSAFTVAVFATSPAATSSAVNVQVAVQVTGAPVHDDRCAYTDRHGLTRHKFVADSPNDLWLTDITEHRTTWILLVVAIMRLSGVEMSRGVLCTQIGEASYVHANSVKLLPAIT